MDRNERLTDVGDGIAKPVRVDENGNSEDLGPLLPISWTCHKSNLRPVQFGLATDENTLACQKLTSGFVRDLAAILEKAGLQDLVGVKSYTHRDNVILIRTEDRQNISTEYPMSKPVPEGEVAAGWRFYT